MKQPNPFRRVLALLLTIVMVLGIALPAGAVDADSVLHFELTQIDNSAVTAGSPMTSMGTVTEETTLDPNEMVRVSIQLESAPTIDAGFELKGIGENETAMLYRSNLLREQETLTAAIERRVLGGGKLDVVWNMTLAANIISANVPRSAIEGIAALDGVRAVVEETRYTPDVVCVGGEYTPDMAVSGQMTGASAAWMEGYTGAGSLIAVIDTGLDTDHQSFSPEAFGHAIAEVEAEKGVTYDLMDAEEISAVLTELNAYKRVAANGGTLTAEDLYINAKTAYGYNYIDGDLDVTHDNDDQGEHGSHVAGIASANRYIQQNGRYVDALSNVFVAGDAPDAQLLVMKVFGKNGGAYDSDIMVAIEDAMILGADAVNLSLGSASAGMAAVENSTYRALLERVVDSGMVLVASAGNDGAWADYSTTGYLYNDGVNFDTVGTPASYASALAVASVDNDGVISPSLVAGGKTMGYTESLTDSSGLAFGNTAISALDTSVKGSGTDYEFVLIDGVGNLSDYEGVDLTGKIAICARGDLYYTEKANNAASLGAAALIVYNNEAGTVYMDLTDYQYTMPAVFVTKANGEAIKAAAAKQASKTGGVYYTGTITVKRSLSGNYENSEFKTMSSFSSWGVPGDLSLKPEITAPGGNIYSVNGAVPETDQYETMSGTSMSAPQVSGLVALVKQYLAENGLASGTLNARALTQSLLMSTAEPMKEASSNSYYPVFQQGAGLADSSAAIRTPVYLTVDGMADGKVKAELGDDPDRTGVYRFSFKLNNLTSETYSYQLTADLFTQAVFYDTEGNGYLDTLTRAMETDVEFTVDGVSLTGSGGIGPECDFDGDGKVSRADGQALLDHVTLGTELAANAENADLSGDGKVNTYDVHLFLRGLHGTVEVPANGSVTVDVTMTLTTAEKSQLNKETPEGAYVEAYVKALPLATAEGELLPELSIPVLAFYGTWSDPSMFDVGTQVTHATGDESRYSYFDNESGNAVGIVYGDKPSEIWYFGGNPLVPDETYLPQRNAINVERGDRFHMWSYAPIRSAAASRFTAVNTTTGETLAQINGGAVAAAFYYAAYASWMNTPQYFTINLAPELAVGESGLLKLTMATEYDVAEDGTVDWDSLGQGASMEMPFTVDNQYPEILEVTVDTETNVMHVTASDDQYLAGVLLYDVTGRKLLESVGTTASAQSGDTITFEIPLDTVDGYKFIIQTADYANNVVTYDLRYTIGDPAPLPTRLAFDESFQSWSTFGEGTYGWTSEEWFVSDLSISAATAIGEYALICDTDRNLFAVPIDDMLDVIFIRRLDYALTDLTYDASTDTVYGVTGEGLMLAIDKYTGGVTEVGTIGVTTNTLASNGNGTFYCGHYRQDGYYYDFEVYSFTLEAIASPTLLGELYSSYYEPSGTGAMEYDPVNHCIGWFARVPNYSYDESYYFEIDPATGESLLEYSYYPPTPFDKGATALIYPTWGEGQADWTAPTDAVTEVAFGKSQVDVLLGYTAQLTATVYPWNASDRSVTYFSSNPDVATVDENGVVTGVSVGYTDIWASSTLNPRATARCRVVVSELDITVEGILRDEVGDPLFYTWDMTTDGYVRGEKLSNPPMSVAMLPDGERFYLLDSDRGTMHLMDRQGNDLVDYSTYYAEYNYWIWDMSYSNVFSTDAADMVYGIRENLLLSPFTPMTPELVNYDLSMYGVSYLTGITTGGTESLTYEDYYGTVNTVDSEVIYLIDDMNRVWRCNMFLEMGVRYNFVFSVIPTDLKVSYPAEYSGRSSLVVGEDGALYYSAWTGSTNELYRLVYDEDTERYTSTRLGDFGQDVWPAVILEAASNAPETASAPQGSALFLSGAPEGSLDSIAVDQFDSFGAETGGITYDYVNHSVTLPLLAEESSNGLFELRYDPNVLTLDSLKLGGVMTSVDTATPGTIRMGFSDADTLYRTVLGHVTFSYAGSESTEVVLHVLEDGTAEPGTDAVIELHAPVNPFEDVDTDDFFFDPVMWAVEKGITTGATPTLFNPNGQCSRAEAVTFLWRAAGSPEPAGAENPFVDVSESDFFYKAVLWAVEAGVTNGMDASHFGPYLHCNRAQIVTFLWRSQGKPAPASSEHPFTDLEEGAFYFDAVLWAVENGITNGLTNTTFGPNAICNRAQIVTFLYRAMA